MAAVVSCAGSKSSFNRVARSLAPQEQTTIDPDPAMQDNRIPGAPWSLERSILKYEYLTVDFLVLHSYPYIEYD